MATRQLIIWESAADGWTLKQSNLNLHIARNIRLSNGTLDSNLVWQCKPIGPRRRTITWTPKYGLSWTYTVPKVGTPTPVRADGPWQAFDPSEAFDIFPNGTWIVSGSAGRAGWLTVGRNNFYPKKGEHMHVLVGVWDADQRSFIPIYVDLTPLVFGQGTEYQPQESVQVWYEANDNPQSRISEAGLPSGQVDLSRPDPMTGQYYATATYLAQHEEWQYSVDAPPPATSTGLLGGVLPNPYERRRI